MQAKYSLSLQVAVILVLIGLSRLASAQAFSASDSVGSYLLRMERLTRESRTCVLVRGDLEYHMEVISAAKVNIFEGSLNLPDWQQVETMVNNEQLLRLRKADIPAPLLLEQLDLVQLSVNRPGGWQNFTFPAPSTRAPYHQALDPLLAWMEHLRKEKHQAILSEEAGRNNCAPPEMPALQKRQPPSAADTHYVAKIVRNVAKDAELHESCAVIYPDGRFHYEFKTQRAGERQMKSGVIENVISANQINALQELLADPKLLQRTENALPARAMVREEEVTYLAVPRGDQIQQVTFWRYYSPHRIENNGTKLINPLLQWLKANVENEKPLSAVDVAPDGCKVKD
jgi:hypothetical protein